MRRVASPIALLLASSLVLVWTTSPADAQRRDPRPSVGQAQQTEEDAETVHLDFKDVDLAVVIEMIARTTGKNFIYDDKVRDTPLGQLLM